VTQHSPPTTDNRFADDFAFQAASRRADAALATLRIARGLAAGRRCIDLAGLDLDIGRLCAASLDLAPEQGRLIRQRLVAVLAELDALAAALAPP
jgi:hypothetical protein